MIAVTGATGHLGVNVVTALLDRGERVRALIHRASGPLEGLDIEIAHGDVTDAASLREAFAGAEVVVHLAGCISITGGQGGLVERINVGGARNAAQASADCGVRRHVHVSSVHAYDDSFRAIDEHTPPAREDQPAYDRSKHAGERAVLEARPDAVILNPVGVIGPADPEPSRLGRVLRALFRGRMPAVVRGGYSWVDVRDVAEAVLAATDRGLPGECHLLGGHTHSLAELAEMAARIAGRHRAPAVPMWLGRLVAAPSEWAAAATGTSPVLTREGLHTLAACPEVSHERAGRELGFEPRPIEHTLRDLHAWFADRGQV